jgi:hypothetical protein
MWRSGGERVLGSRFTDTQSVLCCIQDARFVLRLRDGWCVYWALWRRI